MQFGDFIVKGKKTTTKAGGMNSRLASKKLIFKLMILDDQGNDHSLSEMLMVFQVCFRSYLF